MATYIDSIKNGVTTVFDHHASFGAITGSLFEIEKAAKESVFAPVSAMRFLTGTEWTNQEEAIQENVEFIKHALADDSDMITGMMGMHASFTISDETMERCAAMKPEGVGYHIHVAEGIRDLTPA